MYILADQHNGHAQTSVQQQHVSDPQGHDGQCGSRKPAKRIPPKWTHGITVDHRTRRPLRRIPLLLVLHRGRHPDQTEIGTR